MCGDMERISRCHHIKVLKGIDIPFLPERHYKTLQGFIFLSKRSVEMPSISSFLFPNISFYLPSKAFQPIKPPITFPNNNINI